ncbi:MAG: hypothetical protein WDW36_001887 [Sanguina aurantia]
MSAKTLFEKVWDAHVVVAETNDTPAAHVDAQPRPRRDVAGRDRCPARDRALARPAATACSPPSIIPPPRCLPPPTANALMLMTKRRQVTQLETNCREFGVELHGWDSDDRGIVHVIGPELGATQPGMTIVCGDSHTSTHGAFGALAAATGHHRRPSHRAQAPAAGAPPKTLAIHVDGQLPRGVGAKDLILHIIGEIGVDGGTGHVIEYKGEAITQLTMDERMTVCNMSIARAGRARAASIAMCARWRRLRSAACALARARARGRARRGARGQWRALRTDDGARAPTCVSTPAR